MQAMMLEFGLESQLKVKGDAVAAMGMVKRQGLGRVRHLAVADLWIQQKAKEGVAKFEKLPGTENTSDIMTKAVESDVLAKHMKALGFEYREGRHELTPDYDGLDDGTPTGEKEEAKGVKKQDPDPDAEDRADHICSSGRKIYQPQVTNQRPRTTEHYSQTPGRLCNVFRLGQPVPTTTLPTPTQTDRILAKRGIYRAATGGRTPVR